MSKKKKVSRKKKIKRLESHIHSCESKIKRIQRSMTAPVQISDHALVRWLERVHGIDVVALKEEIVNDKDEEHIGMGAKKIKKHDHTLVIENNTVVTILGKDGA